MEGSQGSWRATVTMLAIAVGLVAFVNVGTWIVLRSHPVNPGVSRVWQKWMMVERLGAPTDWLILGDSTCGAGFSPAIFEAETGAKALNLCTVANASLVNQAWQLERYIQRHGPPKGVVSLNAFHAWERMPTDLRAMLGQIPLEWGFWRGFEPRLTRAEELRHEISPLFTLYDNSLSVNHLLTKTLPRALRGRPDASPVEGLQEVERAGGQASESRPNPGNVIRQTRSTIRQYESRPFFMTEPSRLAVEAMLSLSDRHGFRLLLANTSVAEDVYRSATFQRFYAEMNAQIRGLVAGHPHAAFILDTPPVFRPEEMNNVDHVVGERAVEAYTRAVADAVRAAGMTGRQPALPHAVLEPLDRE